MARPPVGSVTPMMQQYLAIKEQHPDELLFYRLGDFYEMFFDDALTASRELELTLTGRDCGLPERAPMCGVPYHAVDTYITRLIEKGYRVAICEQMEDPALAKGLVKREIIRHVDGHEIVLATIIAVFRFDHIRVEQGLEDLVGTIMKTLLLFRSLR